MISRLNDKGWEVDGFIQIRPVFQLSLEHRFAHVLEICCHVAVRLHNGNKGRLAEIHQVAAISPSDGGNVSIHRPLPRRNGCIHPRHDPVGRALVNGELFGNFGQFRDDLRRRRAVADDCNLLVFQIIRPVPPRAVHHLAPVVFQPGDIGIVGHVELADGRDEEVGGDGVFLTKLGIFAAGDGDGCFPLLLRVVPVRFVDRGVEPDVLEQAIFLSHSEEIVLTVVN